MFIVAQIQLQRALGRNWWKEFLQYSQLPANWLVSLSVPTLAQPLLRFSAQSEPLWVGYFLSTTAVGYYRVAYTIVSFLSIPADPLISTTFPEINRLVTQRAWPRLKDFLRKVTSLAFAYNLVLALCLVAFGRWIILIYSGEQYISAYPALVALLIGLAFNYTLFWNCPLLLSLGLPKIPITVTLTVGLIKIGLAFLIVPRYGYVAEAALLSFYYIVSVGMMVWYGLREIRHQEQKT